MTQTKPQHAPAPWGSIQRSDNDGKVIVDAFESEIAYSAWRRDDTEESNARLISAAPDLLAALSDLLKEHASLVHSEYDGTGKLLTGMLNTRAMKAARAAITKATNTKP